MPIILALRWLRQEYFRFKVKRGIYTMQEKVYNYMTIYYDIYYDTQILYILAIY